MNFLQRNYFFIIIYIKGMIEQIQQLWQQQ